MRLPALSWLIVAMAVCLPVRGVDLHQRSESGGKQFVVFSSDVRLRQRVASYAAELKTDVLQLLGEPDRWKVPIVITLERATAPAAEESPAKLRLVDTPAGQKIELNVTIGDDPAS